MVIKSILTLATLWYPVRCTQSTHSAVSCQASNVDRIGGPSLLMTMLFGTAYRNAKRLFVETMKPVSKGNEKLQSSPLIGGDKQLDRVFACSDWPSRPRVNAVLKTTSSGG